MGFRGGVLGGAFMDRPNYVELDDMSNSPLNVLERTNPNDPRIRRGGGGIDVSAAARPKALVTRNKAPVDPLVKAQTATNETLQKQNEILEQGNKLTEEQTSMYRKERLALAAVGFGLDVMNANSEYRNVTGQAAFNIIQSKNQAADALYRGRQAGAQAQSEGNNAGDEALLALAAQGQDVSGAGAQRVAGSYQAMGAYNAMIEEVNAMRQALGFELEQINYEYQTDVAAINRENAIIGSALNFGATAAGVL